MKNRLMRFVLFELRGCSLYYKYKAYLIRKKKCDKNRISVPRPGIIYMADGMCNPGGICDRLLGILSLYKISKEKNIPFFINFTEPFNLSDYLLPGTVDWIIQKEEIASSRSQAQVLYVFCASAKYGYDLYKESEIQKKYIYDNIPNRNRQYQVYTNAHIVDKPLELSELFNELFIPSKKLAEAINNNKTKIKDKYISIVLRFQNLLGDFKEGNILPLEEQEQKKLIDKLHKKIIEIHQEYCNYKILITSDSRKFLDSLNSFDFVYTIPGKVVHMSFSEDKSFETHLKSFVDLYMVSQSEKIFLLSSGNRFSVFPFHMLQSLLRT